MEDQRTRLMKGALSGHFGPLDEAESSVAALARDDLALACALCRPGDALPLIARGADVNKSLAPFDWPPLLYLCFSRVQRRDGAAEAACTIAQSLLESGADPNVCKPSESESHPETALYGAAGVNGNDALTVVLLNAGADPNDRTDEIGPETIYHAAELPSNACLRALLKAGVDRDKLSYCLGRKLDFEDPQGTALFLDHGADPNFVTPFGTYETRVHKAIRSDRSLFVLDLLLNAGGRVDTKDAEGHTPYALAVRYGRTFHLGRLLQAGAKDEEADDLARFLGICARGDRPNARRMAKDHPDVLQRAIDGASAHLAAMAFEGRHAAVALMLDLGFPADARGDFGSALHMACWRGHAAAARALIAAGADFEAKNDFGGTPVDTTVYAAFNCHSPEGGMITWGLPEDVRHGDYPGTLRLLLEAGADPSVVETSPTGRDDIDTVLADWRR